MKFNVAFLDGHIQEIDSVTVKNKIAEYLYDTGKVGVRIEDDGNGYEIVLGSGDYIRLDYGDMAAIIITMKALTTAGKGCLVKASLIRQDKPIKVKF